MGHHIGDFDLAFAYEAIARAYMIDQDLNSMMEYLQLAKEAANHIGDPKERDYLLSELQTISLDSTALSLHLPSVLIA